MTRDGFIYCSYMLWPDFYNDLAKVRKWQASSNYYVLLIVQPLIPKLLISKWLYFYLTIKSVRNVGISDITRIHSYKKRSRRSLVQFVFGLSTVPLVSTNKTPNYITVLYPGAAQSLHSRSRQNSRPKNYSPNIEVCDKLPKIE